MIQAKRDIISSWITFTQRSLLPKSRSSALPLRASSPPLPSHTLNVPLQLITIKESNSTIPPLSLSSYQLQSFALTLSNPKYFLHNFIFIMQKKKNCLVRVTFLIFGHSRYRGIDKMSDCYRYRESRYRKYRY